MFRLTTTISSSSLPDISLRDVNMVVQVGETESM
jgi:hypothetical protein